MPPVQNDQQKQLRFITNLKFASQIVIFTNAAFILFIFVLIFTNSTIPTPFFLHYTEQNPFVAGSLLLANMILLLKFDEESSFASLFFANVLSLIIIGFGVGSIFAYVNQSEVSQFITNIQTGIALTVLGLTLISFHHTLFRTAKVYHILTLSLGIVALYAFISFTFVLLGLQTASVFTPMDLSSTVSIFMLCFSLLLARPNHGIMRILTTPLTVSKLARRLLIATFFIPVFLVYVLICGEKAELYSVQTEVSLLAISIIIIFSWLIWWMTSLLYKNDIERIQKDELIRSKSIQLENATKLLEDKVNELEASKTKIQQLLLYQDQVRNFDA